MDPGRHTTFEVLAKSRNRAAVPLLAKALRAASADDRALAIRCLASRPDSASHHLLIREFDRLATEPRLVVRSAYLAMPNRLAATLKQVVIHAQAELCENACQMIVLCRDFELFPALVQAAEHRQDLSSSGIGEAIRQLARMLYEELANQPADAENAGRDPAFARRNILVALERSLTRFASHGRRELLEAFLLLAPRGDPTLAKMLRDPRHPCHATLCDLLSASTTSGLIEQLVELLRDTDAPEAVLEIIARRSDGPFVTALLSHMKHPVSLRALHNMKRLCSVAWLEKDREMLLEFDGRAQAIAVELALASSIRAESLFDLLAMFIHSGLAEGRRASCAALKRFNTHDADVLVRQALNDPDGGVRAAAVQQIRQRGFPDAMKLLVECLDSHAVEVRETARATLAEFNYVRYRGMFDLLDELGAQSTGRLVRKVDENALPGLLEDLSSPSISARLRAIEMAVAMDATGDASDQIIALASSENLELRQQAIAALGSCSGPKVEEALELAAGDSHHVVREAAERSLKQVRAT
jgi:HEAT repeat protein